MQKCGLILEVEKVWENWILSNVSVRIKAVVFWFTFVIKLFPFSGISKGLFAVFFLVCGMPKRSAV